MEYRITKTGDAAEVTLTGAVTFTENLQFRNLMKELSGQKLQSATFNVEAVDRIDSTGLGMFLIAQESAKKENWTLKIRGANAQVKKTMQLAALSNLLDD